MDLQERIDLFMEGSPHAVVGASRDRAKYGNKVLRSYLQKGRTVYAVNPNVDEVEGQRSYADLHSLPEKVHGISIITPPSVSARVIEQAAELGIKNIWLQPGAENDEVVRRAAELGMNVIAGGPCALVVMGYRE